MLLYANIIFKVHVSFYKEPSKWPSIKSFLIHVVILVKPFTEKKKEPSERNDLRVQIVRRILYFTVSTVSALFWATKTSINFFGYIWAKISGTNSQRLEKRESWHGLFDEKLSVYKLDNNNKLPWAKISGTNSQRFSVCFYGRAKAKQNLFLSAFTEEQKQNKIGGKPSTQ